MGIMMCPHCDVMIDIDVNVEGYDFAYDMCWTCLENYYDNNGEHPKKVWPNDESDYDEMRDEIEKEYKRRNNITTHTPGPWTAGWSFNNVWNIQGPKVPYDGADGYIEADAHLIAAAPDLLDAAEELWLAYDAMPDDKRGRGLLTNGKFFRLKQAIDKARKTIDK